MLDSILIYAAFELRMAIERYFFDLLLLMKNSNLTEEDEKRCRSISGLQEMMRETDVQYRKTISFTKLMVSIHSDAPEILVVDTSYLRRKWSDLSEFCHKQLDPEKTFESENREFQEKGYKLIYEVLDCFSRYSQGACCGMVKKDSMSEEVKDLYEKYLIDEVTDEQVKSRLDLMQPVLQMRYKRTKSFRLGK